MKRFFSKNGLLLLSAAATVVVILCVISAISSGTPFLRNVAGVIASPFRAAGSAVAGWVADGSAHFDNVETLQEENDELRRYVAELEEELRRAQSATEENRRLREVLGLATKNPDYVFVEATVTERSVSNWFSVLTINCGTSDGVAIGQCVTDEYGNLVGTITDAGHNWSRITTLLDTDSSVGATVFRTGDVAVTEGRLELMEEGCLALCYLTDPDRLVSGDQVVTSGLGGYLPEGLVIGTVREVRVDDGGVNRYAVVKANVTPEKLVEVFVIRDFGAAE
ncbi:MAG: rod shape-determining protein MreC [Oscillospiraceae bacterium]|nr:rod shape-determining protein MreC [Oscillospiraceae bacterium]